MDKAAALYEIEKVIAKGPFNASMFSLKGYQVPAWYADGKFGIFIHWGPYCVPAFGNEWYPRQMYQPGSKEFEHHVATYGPQKQFGYKDFIPMFKAEQFDPNEWAELFKDAGARFVVPVAEHHDGFQMYKSEVSHWNAYEMGPHRDICGELADAVRAQGMVFGASSHRAEHYWFMDGVHKCESDYTPELEGFYGPAMPHCEQHENERVTAFPSAAHMDDWLVRTCEIVDRFHPQIVWFDWWINNYAWKPYLEKFAAYYYNRGAEWGVGVAINYKYEAYDKGCAVFDVERGQLSEGASMLWQNDTSVSKNSWGYIDNHDYKQPIDILCDLVDIVAKNGALLLNIGPKADGTIPEPEKAILRAIGAWLKDNGEAIYGTHAWRVFGEGPTQVPEGAFTDTKRDAFTGQDIRYTQKDGALYAMLLGKPENGEVVLASVTPECGFIRASCMCGKELVADMQADGLHVKLPKALLDKQLPLVVKLTK